MPARPRNRATLAAAAACAAMMGTIDAPRVARAEGGRWLGGLEIGFDSFQENYSIADEDTLARIAEFRSRLRIAYTMGSLLGDYALAEARSLIGENDYEAGARVFLTGRWGRHRLHFDSDVTRRGFHDDTVYEFPNDHTRVSVRGGARSQLGPAVVLRLDDRVEHVDYERRTEFDYDFLKNSVTVAAELSRDPAAGVSLGVRLTSLAVPDSAEIEYTAVIPLIDLRAAPEPHRRLQLGAGAERRVYPDGGARSSFWAIRGSATAEWPLAARWSVEVEDVLEHYAYEEDSGAYFDYVENATDLLVRFGRDGYQVGAGPAFAFMKSGGSPEDEYREYGGKLTLDATTTSTWVSAAYHPGLRDYDDYEDTSSSQSETVFSDYTFHRVLLFADARIHRALTLHLFIDYQPEDHDRKGDDATATLLSVSLSYTF